MRKPVFIFMGISIALIVVYMILYLAVIIPTFGYWFYDWQFNSNDTYDYIDIEEKELEEVSRHLISYLQGKSGRYGLQINTIIGGEDRLFFNELELSHMQDVYDLFANARKILWGCVIYFILSAGVWILAFKKDVQIFIKSFCRTIIAVIGVFISLVIGVSFDWRAAFRAFHHIFFDNSNWILDQSTDLLIRLMPNEFFIAISMVIALLFLVGLLVLLGVSYIFKLKLEKELKLWI